MPLFIGQLALPDPGRGIKDEVAHYFRHISRVRTNFAPNLDTPGGRLYFVSLTYPDVTEAAAVIDELTNGTDAIELRVDILYPSQNPQHPAKVVRCRPACRSPTTLSTPHYFHGMDRVARWRFPRWWLTDAFCSLLERWTHFHEMVAAVRVQRTQRRQ